MNPSSEPPFAQTKPLVIEELELATRAMAKSGEDRPAACFSPIVGDQLLRPADAMELGTMLRLSKRWGRRDDLKRGDHVVLCLPIAAIACRAEAARAVRAGAAANSAGTLLSGAREERNGQPVTLAWAVPRSRNTTVCAARFKVDPNCRLTRRLSGCAVLTGSVPCQHAQDGRLVDAVIVWRRRIASVLVARAAARGTLRSTCPDASWSCDVARATHTSRRNP